MTLFMILDYLLSRFTEEHINYLKIIMPSCDAGFFEWLSSIDCSGITIYAMKEGTVASRDCLNSY